MEVENASDLPGLEAIHGGKWFWPILVRLDAFEVKLGAVLPVMEPALSDDSPDWSVRCLLDVARADSEVNGYCDVRKIGARDLGRIVGAKFSLCDAMAKSLVEWDSVRPEQVAELESAMEQPGYVAACREIARKFAEELTPELVGVKRSAIELAIKASGVEEIEYLIGYTEGAKFMDRVRASVKPARTKRQRDSANRMIVLFFAAMVGEAVEESKGELSWPEFHRLFMTATEYQVSIDEDTFKKILSRKGLKGVGKVGRPVPIEDLPVKRTRRNADADSE
jgi:hypothetical protein